MHDMIKRIVEMDKKAQEITKAAQQEKLQLEKEITEKVVLLREDALDRARKRIQANRETEMAILEEQWQKKKKEYDAQYAAIQDLFVKNGGKWTRELTNRVLIN